MNYYQHHIGDFIRDTARLSNDQCMAYLRLIWHYYDTEQPLETDVDALAFKIGANASDVHQILRHFFFEHEGRWHHSRCDREILAFREKSEKAKKSADARWKNANAMRTHSERNADEPVSDANQEPTPNTQEPLPNTSNAYALEGEQREKKSRPGKKVPMPDDFMPNETGIRYAEDRHVDVQSEMQKMRNWVEQNRVLRVDWQATWRTWCDKAVEFGRAGKQINGSRTEKFDPVAYVNQHRKGTSDVDTGNAAIDGTAHRVA